MTDPFASRAREIVEDWMREQLRQEGRDGIYVDDEAVLALEISRALSAVDAAAFARGIEAAVEATWDYRCERMIHEDAMIVEKCLERIRKLLPARRGEVEDEMV